MNLDISVANGWLSLLLSIVAICGVLKAYFSSGAREMLKDLVLLKERVQKLETEMDFLPDRDGLQRLEVNMERLNGRLNTLSAQLQPVAAIGERLQEFLLENAKK
ncbi:MULTISPECIES: DUF2730 family protein [Bartonella]|uniref:DUF2730 family protein n=1 Tax=Bartonella TaxID=773 RepID=UPI0002B6DCDE|nr:MULTISPECIES: DUF2730 family protein [Bartonella]AGF75833.1 hypothetical protein BVwin_07240 [Bartonella vinsonii subsp. berkhoffii str. Winnie]UNE53522.1 DUF2730 domain-containing protein [Bartonella machadoae]UNE54184.1 DUF2730 domain-containing protein [Bartonella machadoae]UNE55103.1 DUF2730 domain-containing protein [Bartonella machadoae]